MTFSAHFPPLRIAGEGGGQLIADTRCRPFQEFSSQKDATSGQRRNARLPWEGDGDVSLRGISRLITIRDKLRESMLAYTQRMKEYQNISELHLQGSSDPLQLSGNVKRLPQFARNNSKVEPTTKPLDSEPQKVRDRSIQLGALVTRSLPTTKLESLQLFSKDRGKAGRASTLAIKNAVAIETIQGKRLAPLDTGLDAPSGRPVLPPNDEIPTHHALVKNKFMPTLDQKTAIAALLVEDLHSQIEVHSDARNKDLSTNQQQRSHTIGRVEQFSTVKVSITGEETKLVAQRAGAFLPRDRVMQSSDSSARMLPVTDSSVHEINQGMKNSVDGDRQREAVADYGTFYVPKALLPLKQYLRASSGRRAVKTKRMQLSQSLLSSIQEDDQEYQVVSSSPQRTKPSHSRLPIPRSHLMDAIPEADTAADLSDYGSDWIKEKKRDTAILRRAQETGKLPQSVNKYMAQHAKRKLHRLPSLQHDQSSDAGYIDRLLHRLLPD